MYYFGYCRVSSTKQVLEGVSLEMQRNKIEEYAKSKNIIVKIIMEEGLSAKRNSIRPKYNQTLKTILNDINCKGLITYSLSRIGRSMQQLITDVNQLDNNHKDIIFLKENIDRTTISGKMLFNILCAFAEFENEMRREALSDGYKQYRENKGIVGRKNMNLINFDEIIKDYNLGASLSFLCKKVIYLDFNKRQHTGISKPTLIKKLREYNIYKV